MSVVALATWITAAGGGLYLLSIWLIEYDQEFQSATATRLPPAVLAGHVLLAVGGLVVWAAYLLFDDDELTWVAVAALGMAAALGLFMAHRWVGVYRADQRRRPEPVLAGRGQQAASRAEAAPPERNFPLPVVIGHGIFAFVTIALVLLVALGIGGS